jgi:hypothetical protein
LSFGLASAANSGLANNVNTPNNRFFFIVILVDCGERTASYAVADTISMKKLRQKSPVSFGQTRYPAC